MIFDYEPTDYSVELMEPIYAVTDKKCVPQDAFTIRNKLGELTELQIPTAFRLPPHICNPDFKQSDYCGRCQSELGKVAYLGEEIESPERRALVDSAFASKNPNGKEWQAVFAYDARNNPGKCGHPGYGINIHGIWVCEACTRPEERSTNNPYNRYEVACGHCGRTLISMRLRKHGEFKFCSGTCEARARRARQGYTRWKACLCTVCGTRFAATRWDARYCSGACRQSAWRTRR